MKIRMRPNAPETLAGTGAAFLLIALVAITSPFPEEAAHDEGIGRVVIASLYGWLVPATIGAIALGTGFFLVHRRGARQ